MPTHHVVQPADKHSSRVNKYLTFADDTLTTTSKYHQAHLHDDKPPLLIPTVAEPDAYDGVAWFHIFLVHAARCSGVKDGVFERVGMVTRANPSFLGQFRTGNSEVHVAISVLTHEFVIAAHASWFSRSFAWHRIGS